MKDAANFLGPVNELPPEGADLEPSRNSEVDFVASMFTDSELTFDVSRDGVFLQSDPRKTDLFQEFEVDLDASEEESYLLWKDNAFDLHLQGLFRDNRPFEALSDASEPEDYVRKFLEVLSSSLDDPAIKHDGATLPLIRWQAGENGESAQVQLLGLLLATDEQFQQFCENQDGDLGLIFEDAEVEAHGIREVVATVALLGITMSATTSAQAGLFNFKANKKAKQMRIAQLNAIQEAQRAPIQNAQRTGYLDVHNDAYINYQLLEAGKNTEKKVIVDIGRQRAYLLVGNQVAIDTAVSTARSDKHTPRGTFKVTERIAHGKMSTIYDVEMPYWQRLDSTAIGMHIGDLPGYPASAGCIRLPHSVAPVLFANMNSGMTVEVVDLWDAQELQQQQPVQVAQVSHYSR
ncbi:MAG: L,D-transpeptidase [Verrucomicrobiales bacterium]|nr:L,D-transpeptidase [Verrucomicrobiales bacterium]